MSKAKCKVNYACDYDVHAAMKWWCFRHHKALSKVLEELQVAFLKEQGEIIPNAE